MTYFNHLGGDGTDESVCGTDQDPLRDYCVNQKSIAGTGWDAAHMAFGGKWRMPTAADYEELMDENNCSWTFTEQNGVRGILFQSKINGNSVFFPLAGWRDGNVHEYWDMSCEYWSATPSTTYKFARDFSYYSGHFYGSSIRKFGQPVRPVCE